MKSIQWTRLAILALFVVALLAGINYMVNRTPSEDESSFILKAKAFAENVQSAHWQWQAERQPQRILLLLYNEAGIERDRRPVPMSPEGWPTAKPSKEGCLRLWRQVMGEDPRMNQQRIRAYYSGPDEPVQGDRGECRYSLPMGPDFVYDINTGEVDL